MGHQRSQHLSRDVCSRAFKSLHYFELARPPHNMRRPDARSHIDDVFEMSEEDESVY